MRKPHVGRFGGDRDVPTDFEPLSIAPTSPPTIGPEHRPRFDSAAAGDAPALSPELLRELERVAGLLPLPSAQIGAMAEEIMAFTGTLDGGVLDRIHACRTSIERVLDHTSKEFQVLKILQETDLGVCSDLAQQLRQRLDGHALYQIKMKLDEAYTLALRYRKPDAANP